MKRKEKKKEKKEHSNPLNFSATLPFVAGEDGFIFLWGLIISVWIVNYCKICLLRLSQILFKPSEHQLYRIHNLSSVFLLENVNQGS